MLSKWNIKLLFDLPLLSHTEKAAFTSVTWNSANQVFCSFQDIFKQATEDRLTSAKELPYFEGDFWPNVLEESIKELEQEEEERKREENTSNESTDVRMLLLFHDLL